MGRAWWPEEEEALRSAVQRYGVGAWEAMRKDEEYKHLLGYRSGMQLKDKWRNLIKFGHLPVREILAAPKRPVIPSAQVADKADKPNAGRSRSRSSGSSGSRRRTTGAQQQQQTSSDSSLLAGPRADAETQQQRSRSRSGGARKSNSRAAPTNQRQRVPPKRLGDSPEASLAGSGGSVAHQADSAAGAAARQASIDASSGASPFLPGPNPYNKPIAGPFQHVQESCESARAALEQALQDLGVIGYKGGLNIEEIREQFGGTAAAAIQAHQKRLMEGKAPLPPPVKRRASGKRKSRARPMEVPTGYKKGIRSAGMRKPRKSPWPLVVPAENGKLMRETFTGEPAEVLERPAKRRYLGSGADGADRETTDSLSPTEAFEARVEALGMGEGAYNHSDSLSLDDYVTDGSLSEDGGSVGADRSVDEVMEKFGEGVHGGMAFGGAGFATGGGVPAFHMPAAGPPPELLNHMQYVMRTGPVADALGPMHNSTMAQQPQQLLKNTALNMAPNMVPTGGVTCDLLATALTMGTPDGMPMHGDELSPLNGSNCDTDAGHSLIDGEISLIAGHDAGGLMADALGGGLMTDAVPCIMMPAPMPMAR